MGGVSQCCLVTPDMRLMYDRVGARIARLQACSGELLKWQLISLSTQGNSGSVLGLDGVDKYSETGWFPGTPLPFGDGCIGGATKHIGKRGFKNLE